MSNEKEPFAELASAAQQLGEAMQGVAGGIHELAEAFALLYIASSVKVTVFNTYYGFITFPTPTTVGRRPGRRTVC